MIEHVGEVNPVSTFSKVDDEVFLDLNRDLRLLTSKEIIYGANVDEDGLQRIMSMLNSLKITPQRGGMRL